MSQKPTIIIIILSLLLLSFSIWIYNSDDNKPIIKPINNNNNDNRYYTSLLRQMTKDPYNILYQVEMTFENDCLYGWQAFVKYGNHFKDIIFFINDEDKIIVNELLDISFTNNYYVRIFQSTYYSSQNSNYTIVDDNHFEYKIERIFQHEYYMMVTKIFTGDKYNITIDSTWKYRLEHVSGIGYPKYAPLYIRDCLKVYLENPSSVSCEELLDFKYFKIPISQFY